MVLDMVPAMNIAKEMMMTLANNTKEYGFSLGTRCGRGHANAVGFGCGYGNPDCSGDEEADDISYYSGAGDISSKGCGSGISYGQGCQN